MVSMRSKKATALPTKDKEEIFISESGKSYNIKDIAYFFQKGSPPAKTTTTSSSGVLFLKHDKSSLFKKPIDQVTGMLIDYKNNNPNSLVNINLFSVNDIKNLLMKFPKFQKIIEIEPHFKQKEEIANAITADTLQLLEEISKNIANGNSLKSDKVWPLIKNLHTILTENVEDSPEKNERLKEREALVNLTEYDFMNSKGLSTYGAVRRKTVISDLTDMLKSDDCPAPHTFIEQITNLYAVIQTHRNYQEAQNSIALQQKAGVSLTKR